MESLFLVIATLCYLSGTVGYLVYLFRDREQLHRISWTILLVGALFHGAALVMRTANTGHLPVDTIQEALSPVCMGVRGHLSYPANPVAASHPGFIRLPACRSFHAFIFASAVADNA